MNRKIVFLVAALCHLIYTQVDAQKQQFKIDSLRNALSVVKEDTSRVVLLNNLSGALIQSNPDSSLFYATQALDLAGKIGWKPGIAVSLYSRGFAYKNLGTLDSALTSEKEAELYFKELNDTANLIKVYVTTGLIYNTTGDFPKALENYFGGLRMAEERRDSFSISKFFLNIGLTYYHEKEYEKALTHYGKALIIQEHINDKNSIGSILVNQGLIYNRQGKKQLALESYEKALENFRAVENKLNIATTLSNIGTLNVEMLNYSKALTYQWEALSMFNSMKDKAGISRSLSNIGFSYLSITKDTISKSLPDSLRNKDKLLNRAIVLLEEAIEIKRQINELNGLQNSYSTLSSLYESKGNYPAALEYMKKHITLRDSVFNMESKEKIANLEARRETELKEKEIQIQKLQLSILEKQRSYYIVAILFVLLLSIILIYQYKLRQTIHLVNLRTRIASDLHDDVSSTLSSISISSSIIQKKLKDQSPEVNMLLKQISNNTEAVMESMHDIIWTINTENQKFDNIVNRMRAFAVEILEPKNCSVHFQVEENLNGITLNMEQRKNTYLIFKEIIHNAAKYANCKNVYVKLGLTGKKLMMSVKDDGIGFENSSNLNGRSKGGNGLPNMKKRAEQLKGTLHIASEIGKGTHVVFEVEC